MRTHNLGWGSWMGIVTSTVTAGLHGAAPAQFVPAPDLVLPRLESVVPGGLDLHFLSTGQLLLGGGFTWVNDEAHAGLVRLNTDGSVDTTYSPEVVPGFAYFGTRSYVVQSDGTVYVLADQSNGIRDRVWRLQPDGQRDPAFELVAGWVTPLTELGSPSVVSIAAGTGGRVLVWGSFDQLGGVAATDVALVQADGTVNGAFSWDFPVSLAQALPLDDGRWITIGTPDFGVPAPGETVPIVPREMPRTVVMRVLANGTLDPTFQTHVFWGSYSAGPHAFVLDDLDRLVFAEPGPLSSRYSIQLGRLRTDGTRDPDFAPILPEIVDPIRSYATASSRSETSSTTVPESRPLVYIPPTLNRIVPAGNGGVMCFAQWTDPSWRGVVGVADDGTFDETLSPYTGPVRVHWLRRDSAGTWWGEFSTLTATGAPTVGPGRLHPDGTVDSSFAVKATVEGVVHHVAALPGGAVVVEGAFDLAGGVASPGLAIIESNGTVRANREVGALPWTRSSIAAVLADGSILAQPAPPPAYALNSLPVVSTEAPRLGRLFADGSWQTLVPPVPDNFYAANGWLDASGRVVVHVPGWSTLGGEELRSDLLRFLPDGSFDAGLVARHQGDQPVALSAAAAASNGVGAWGITWVGNRQHVLRFDDDGQSTRAVPLWLNAVSPYTRRAHTIAGVAGGVVVGGNFEEINHTYSPGLARIRDDGSIDATWGGWVRSDSIAYETQSLRNGLVLVAGDLRTLSGSRGALLLTAEGLPVPVQPEFSGQDHFHSPWFVAPDGDWIVQLLPASPATGARVARWLLAPTPAIEIFPSRTSIRVGDTLSLGVNWVGVFPVGVTWYRNGVPLNPSTDYAWSFLVRAEDDGAVFWAFVRFEGGEGYFTQPWRLDVSVPWARVTNASIRAMAGVGDDRLILGSVLGGTGGGRLLTRALGPALGDLGLDAHAGAVWSDVVRPGGLVVAPPVDYRVARDLLLVSHPDIIAAASAVGAYLPAFNRFSGNDQMLYENLGAGAYHFQVAPQQAADAGVVLAEVFTLSSGGPGRRGLGVRNFSGRAVLRPGSGVLIGGFVIEGDQPMRLLVRGVGPGLAGFGVPHVAANPRLEVHRGAVVLGGNDDWSATDDNRLAVEAAQVSTGAFALAGDSLDAAAVFELDPGLYTIVVTSDDPADVGRVALLEVYALE